MDLSLLAAEQQPIPLHAYAAFLAILLGAIQFAGPKGTATHRYLGYTWVGLMLVVSVSSFWINTINLVGPFSPIHILSAFTIWSLFEAVKAARKGRIDIVQLLLNNGVTDKNTAMYEAAREGRINIVQLMLDNGATNYQECYDVGNDEIKELLKEYM